jgi:hypothetical protein
MNSITVHWSGIIPTLFEIVSGILAIVCSTELTPKLTIAINLNSDVIYAVCYITASFAFLSSFTSLFYIFNKSNTNCCTYILSTFNLIFGLIMCIIVSLIYKYWNDSGIKYICNSCIDDIKTIMIYSWLSFGFIICALISWCMISNKKTNINKYNHTQHMEYLQISDRV